MFLGYLVLPGEAGSQLLLKLFILGFFSHFVSHCDSNGNGFLSIPQIILYATTHIFVPLMITVLTYFVVLHNSAITALTNT